ncbi:MAG: hypothetical protein WCW35_15095 [Bacteroidota bacterium]
MKITWILAALLAIIIFQPGCKKDPPVVPPPDPEPTHPTIVWTADTIRNPYTGNQLLLRSLWGSDTNDVYAIGHNAFGGRASLFHFNGIQWERVILTKGEGGFIGSYVSFIKIDGSGKNDVWAVGSRGGYYGTSVDSSLVIHYDGISWKEVQMERCKDIMQGLKVLSPNDVYMTGSYGEIYHFDGNEFSKTIVDTNLAMRIGGDQNRMFVGGRTFTLFPIVYMSVYSKTPNGQWTLVKTANEVDYYKSKSFGYYDFYPAGGGKYFVGGENVFSLQDTTWESSYSKGSPPYLLFRGTSSQNIFALSPWNSIIHWNGVDWQPINMPTELTQNMSIAGMWVKDKNIFVSCFYTTDTNIIYRGIFK